MNKEEAREIKKKRRQRKNREILVSAASDCSEPEDKNSVIVKRSMRLYDKTLKM